MLQLVEAYAAQHDDMSIPAAARELMKLGASAAPNDMYLIARGSEAFEMVRRDATTRLTYFFRELAADLVNKIGERVAK